MKLFLLAILVVTAIGCGKSETVTIGEPGEKGVYRREIDKSKDTADEATKKVKQDDEEGFGS
jgi:dihydroxyacetone kinase